VLVVSHERSGTHFLMNTLALNFGYVPHTDLDERPGFNPRSTPRLLEFLLSGWPPRTVLKSHHAAELLPALPMLAEVFAVFYVVRDPRDALLSFWRFVAASPPGTGPLTATPGEFLRAAPAGRLLRYQRHAAASMVDRWRLHVEGWNAAAARFPGRLTVVRYADLDERFAATVGGLAAALGSVGPGAAPRRPSPLTQVVHPGAGGSGQHRAAFSAADQEFVLATAGETMRRLGCGAP
jgi:Sulfotransferase domain